MADDPYQPQAIGIEDDDAHTLESISVGFDELPVGGLDGAILTIVGISIYTGSGQEIQNRDGSTRIDNDRLTFDCRVENRDDIDYADEFAPINFTLKKPRERDGKLQRPDPRRNSGWGSFLAALEEIGVSKNPEKATIFRMEEIKDLYGMQWGLRKATNTFTANGREQQYQTNVPTEIYGWVNEVREQHGLAPIVEDESTPGHFVKAAATKKK